MLNIGGVLKCRINQYTPGFFHIYILLSDLGIEPGEVMIANETFLSQYLKEENIDGNWYTRLYAYSVRKSKNKKRRRLTKIPDSSLDNLEFYNEGTVVTNEEMKDSDPLYWVGMMNNFKNQAEEIVGKELIYV